MAYRFFPKNQTQTQNQTTSVPALSRVSHPPFQPPPPQPPKSAITKTRPNAKEECFDPYPDTVEAGYATTHPHVTIETVGTAHIPSLTRITGLLLPIRYPNSFYTATITDPVIASLSRVAIYHDHPVTAAPSPNSSTPGTDKVIGGIRCRLERIESQGAQDTNLYIQTLHLLSPYRGHGIAAALLHSLLFDEPPSTKSKHQYRVSKLVKHYSIRSVTAHVHEANEDGLRWYTARGFEVQEGTVEGYYRRLKPSGAKIVKLDLRWQEEDEQATPAHEQQTEHEDAKPAATDRADPDEGWEKIEAHDGEEDDHGVQLLPDSQSFEGADTPCRKRKAEEEKGNAPQRR